MRVPYSCARRGASPVLATLVLVSVTLSVGVAVAGYSFTLFSKLQTTADVQVVNVACSVSQSACILELRNMGNGVAYIPGPFGCTVYGSTAATAVNGGSSTVGIPGGQDSTLTCQFGSLPSVAVPGVHVEGAIIITNGMQIPFTTIWQP